MPTTAEMTPPTEAEDRGAAFWRSGLPLAVASAEGTTSTQEVEVMVVTPPSSRVEVKVWGTALEVRLVPVPVMVLRVVVGLSVAEVSWSSSGFMLAYLYETDVLVLSAVSSQHARGPSSSV